jgi:hypothetical protein
MNSRRLNPTRMLLLINFTNTRRRNSQANRLSAATVKAAEAGNLHVALYVALSHCPHRSGDHERDGGGRPDGKLAPRPPSR